MYIYIYESNGPSLLVVPGSDRAKATSAQAFGSCLQVRHRFVSLASPSLTGSEATICVSRQGRDRILGWVVGRKQWPLTPKMGWDYKRFSGNDLDSLACRQWKLWAHAKMLSMRGLQKNERGPFVYCLLDGVALETVEHVKLEELARDNGDEVIWTALDSRRFPNKLQHDHLAERLKEVFHLSPREGETMDEWTAKVHDTFSRCCRKVNVEFPQEAQGACTNLV